MDKSKSTFIGLIPGDTGNTLKVSGTGSSFAAGDISVGIAASNSLLEASELVRTLQKRQGLQIACLEEIALTNGFIDAAQVRRAGEALSKTAYGQYLLDLAGR